MDLFITSPEDADSRADIGLPHVPDSDVLDMEIKKNNIIVPITPYGEGVP